MRVCKVCNKEKMLNEFSSRPNGIGKRYTRRICINCVKKANAAHMKNRSETNPKAINKSAIEYWRRMKHTEKFVARKNLSLAISARKIFRPDHCSACKKKCVPQGHHHDYSKHLDVTWLCYYCHKEVHDRAKESARKNRE